MRCPSCRAIDMITVHDGERDIELDFCPRCDGMWLDRGELERLVAGSSAPPDRAAIRQRLAASARHLAPPKHRDCPRCGRGMQSRELAPASGVRIEECTAHGVYLDYGELEAVRAFVAAGGDAWIDASGTTGSVAGRTHARGPLHPRRSGAPPLPVVPVVPPDAPVAADAPARHSREPAASLLEFFVDVLGAIF